MPTYEYACSACGHEWEQSQRITEAPIEVCVQCAKPTAHRLISGGTNFILKGGGWYSDLYSSSKAASKSDNKGDSSGKDGKELKDGGKGDDPQGGKASDKKADSSGGGGGSDGGAGKGSTKAASTESAKTPASPSSASSS